MKLGRVAAAVGVVIVVAILATIRVDPSPDRTRAPRSTARDPATNREESGADAPPVEPATAAQSPPPHRSPDAAVPTDEGTRSVAFDLRGPDDEPLDAGFLFVESERDRRGPLRHDRWIDWSRAAPAVALPEWTRWLRAEADSIKDDLDCHDLVSDPIELDAEGAGASGEQARRVRLSRRPGVFGRIRGLTASPTCRVAWLERAALEGKADPADEVARRGQKTMPRWLGDAEATFELGNLEPGAYALGLQDELGEVLAPLTNVDVVDRMVRVDLQASYDERSSLLVHLFGLSEDEFAQAEFVWVDGAAPTGGWTPLRRDSAGATDFRVTPIGSAARRTMQRVIAGELAPRERCAIAFVRQNEVVAAQPLASGQREVTFTIGADANLTVRARFGAEQMGFRIDLVPASATSLLEGPPGESDDEDADPATVTRTFRRRAPGDFVLQVWRPLSSSLHHGSIWWPIERRALTLHAGDQELLLDAPTLHPLTIRFDRARFGADAKVQLTLRDYVKWPRYATPDADGVARFDDVPRGEYTIAVIGDVAGEAELRIPETSEVTVEPTRREK